MHWVQRAFFLPLPPLAYFTSAMSISQFLDNLRILDGFSKKKPQPSSKKEILWQKLGGGGVNILGQIESTGFLKKPK